MDCLVLGGGAFCRSVIYHVTYSGPVCLTLTDLGISGLATAIALKRSGHNVTVVEKDPVTDKVRVRLVKLSCRY